MGIKKFFFKTRKLVNDIFLPIMIGMLGSAFFWGLQTNDKFFSKLIILILVIITPLEIWNTIENLKRAENCPVCGRFIKKSR